MKFPAPFTYSPYGADSALTFEDVASLRDFLEVERDAWKPLFSSPIRNDQGLERIRANCERVLDQAMSDIGTLSAVTVADQFYQSPFNQLVGRLENFLNEFGQGAPFPGSETELGIKTLAIAKIEPRLAIAYLAMQSPGYAGAIGNTAQGFQVQSLLHATAYLDREEVRVETSGAAKNLHVLHVKFQKRLKEWEKFVSGEVENAEARAVDSANLAKAQSDAFTQAETSRGQEFENFFADVKGQWENLKNTYDNQLALRAPTTYWESESKNNRKKYWITVSAFFVTSSVALGSFLHFGLPYLASGADKSGQNVLVHVLPILVPAFILIWILKIISKLMSGFLQRADDSNERRVMVMTFLALMNNQGNGVPLVNDQDRILILHALFRPAAVSPSDEAPPVHWFDILTSRTKS